MNTNIGFIIRASVKLLFLTVVSPPLFAATPPHPVLDDLISLPAPRGRIFAQPKGGVKVLSSPHNDPRLTRRLKLYSLIEGASPLSIYDNDLVYHFSRSPSGGTAGITKIELSQIPPKPGMLLVRFRDNAFHMYRADQHGLLQKPVRFGEVLEGRFLGLKNGEWTFSEPNTGILSKVTTKTGPRK